MFNPLRMLADAARETAVEVARYWRRALITFLVGVAVLMLVRQPLFQQSILGEPDRQMLTAAFRLRTDVFVGGGDPVLLLDIDNAAIVQDPSRPIAAGREPSASASRGQLADLLRYILTAPPGRGPKAVMLDVDLAAPTQDSADDQTRLHKVLAEWAADPHAPTLVISRESFPADLLGGSGAVRMLPTSDFDDIVSTASNIYWGEVKVLTDLNGVAVETLPYECVQNQGRVEPLFSAALLTYAALQNGQIDAKAGVRQWMATAAGRCKAHPDQPINHGENIDYHLSLPRNDSSRVWPALPPAWPGYRACGRDTDPSVFRRLSAGVIQQAGPDASHDILCRRLVVIGGTNALANDFVQTPLHEMPGAMVLANAARGLQISHGGLRQIPLLVELLMVGLISLAITVGFTLSGRARSSYRRRRVGRSRWSREIALLPLNPVVLNLVAAFLAHWFGVGLMLVALHLGFWGFLSGPAFGSAIAESIQDFTDEKT